MPMRSSRTSGVFFSFTNSSGFFCCSCFKNCCSCSQSLLSEGDAILEDMVAGFLRDSQHPDRRILQNENPRYIECRPTRVSVNFSQHQKQPSMELFFVVFLSARFESGLVG